MKRSTPAVFLALGLLSGLAAAETRSGLHDAVDTYLAAAAPEADTTLHASWKGGPTLATSDGNFSISLVGRLMWDSFWTDSDEFDAIEDGTFFRRARLGVKGTVYKDFFFTIEVDFARGSDVVLTDVFLGMKGLGPVGAVRAGHFKEPFGLETLISANNITFIERAAATEAFSPVRNAGIAFGNAVLDKRATWAIGGFRNTDDAGSVQEEGGYNVTLRITGLPVRDEEREMLVHLGVAVSFRDPTDESVRFRARPGTGTGDRIVDTMAIPADDLLLFGFEAAFVWRSFSVQGEFMLADVSGPSGSADPSFSGWYVQASWWITGETRPYRAADGIFGAVKPKRNFVGGGDRGPGAWEIAVRFDVLDLIDEGIAGGEQDKITIGVNWHLNPNARVMLNAAFADVEGSPLGDGDFTLFTIRFQFHF